ncbi:hypothetical protein P3T23_009198 [Paraburkholderia sp. GAS448]
MFIDLDAGTIEIIAGTVAGAIIVISLFVMIKRPHSHSDT